MLRYAKTLLSNGAIKYLHSKPTCMLGPCATTCMYMYVQYMYILATNGKHSFQYPLLFPVADPGGDPRVPRIPPFSL